MSDFISEDKIKRMTCIKHTKYWINQIKLLYSKEKTTPPIIVIGTHFDEIGGLPKFYNFNRTPNNAKTQLLEFLKYLKIDHFIFYEFSKDKNIFENFCKNLTNKIIENSITYLHPKLGILSSNSGPIINKITILYAIISHNIYKFIENKKKPFMWWDDFIDEFFTKDIHVNDILTIVSLLNNSGVILTYQNRSTAASKIVILDPQWLSDAFATTISIRHDQVGIGKGFFYSFTIRKFLGK